MSFIRSPHNISVLPGLVLVVCTGLALPAAAQDTKSKEPPPERSAASPDSNQNAPAASAKHPRSLPPAERAWEILRAGISFDNANKRAKAVCALGMLRGDAQAEKLAIAALKDQSADVRAAAANALGAMHAIGARTPLEVALDDHEPEVVLAAANSLMELKDANFAYDIYYGVLTGSMRTKGNPIKAEIKDQMKILHDKKKIAELGLEQGVGFVPYGGIGYGVYKTLTKNDNSPMRAAAAKKLARDPDPVSAEALVNATHDKSFLVRVAALEAIAERGDRSLIPKVLDALEDDKDEVRFTGAACIAQLSRSPKRRGAGTAVTASAGTPSAN
jgi:HEAT repeat protein